MPASVSSACRRIPLSTPGLTLAMQDLCRKERTHEKEENMTEDRCPHDMLVLDGKSSCASCLDLPDVALDDLLIAELETCGNGDCEAVFPKGTGHLRKHCDRCADIITSQYVSPRRQANERKTHDAQEVIAWEYEARLAGEIA